eukprot:CAMPEP_0115021094 /NCGR_PEP_ID=MMETSP0216-20121206/30654_1 /TAXON_ID=223996 /ORGANISM="Protocruzia adherens, Strain Boccale" /LENGTH=164 /DNA_ID=CAMNT_0002393329 /DNA_START=306 /DNA_END=800 /DNA_ORIENTATION=-
MSLGSSSDTLVEQGEFDLVISESVGSRSLDIISLLQDIGSDDMDGIGASSVSAGHFHEHSTDGTVQRGVSVFLVHVMNTGSGFISQQNTVGFDMSDVLLEDLVDADDFSGSSLYLVQLADKVPEFGLGKDIIRSEDSHLEDFGVGVFLTNLSSASNNVLADFHG